MTAYAAFLRAINVGGRNLVPMAELRAALEGLCCTDVRTLLQSGNAVFRTGARSAASLERVLQAAVHERCGVDADCFCRDAAAWDALIAANPFRAEAKRDPARLALLLLDRPPAPRQVQALRAAIVGRERIEASGRELYAVYPDGMGKSRLTLPLIEKSLGTRGTARNWNTVLKVAELLGE